MTKSGASGTKNIKKKTEKSAKEKYHKGKIKLDLTLIVNVNWKNERVERRILY